MNKFCPFCKKIKETLFPVAENRYAFAFLDGYPISPGHTLIVPRLHCGDYFDLDEVTQRAMWDLVNEVKHQHDEDHQIDAYNIGINNGSAAGQTVPHCHIHLIPRYTGDVEDPRGGVRWVIPKKAKYWKE